MKSASPSRHSASILATGSYLPERVLTNADLEKMVDTSDEWILTRTGIRERRLAAPGETTTDMAVAAGKQALERAQVKPEEVDLVLVATCTPDTFFPSTACQAQHRLGAPRAAAFDVSAACSGFLYALITAEQFIAAGTYQTVLVIGAERLSSVVNWKDRNTCVLFGDGAGAAVLRHRPGHAGIRAWDMGSDGSQTEILSLRNPGSGVSEAHAPCYIHMVGKEVYRQAVNAMNRSAENTLEKAGLAASDLDLVIPHQANLRIIQSVAERLPVPAHKCFINLDRYGNTSAACIPIALGEAEAAGKLKAGSKVLLVAFGGGLTWASIALEW